MSSQLFCVGFVSNAIPTLIFFPLDTLMVRLQTSYPQHLLTKNMYSGVKRNIFANGLIGALVSVAYLNPKERGITSGIQAGIFSGLLVHPYENIKIYRQTQKNISVPMLRGLHLTLLREIIGTPIYFETYFACHQHMSSFWAGGLSGIHSWIWSYPFSTIKANYILQRKSFYWSLKWLYSGFAHCIVRSFFFNGVSFYTRESLDGLL